MTINAGWTPELSQQQKDKNELRALTEMVVEHPGNEYWINRLDEFMEKRYAQIDEIMGDEPIKQGQYDDLAETIINQEGE